MSNSRAFRLPMTALVTFALTATASSVLGQISIDTVPVGFAGNSSDSTGHGAVSYDYSIGKYEVTNAQYAAFLNSVAKVDNPHGLYFASPGAENRFSGVIRSGLSGSYAYTSKVGYENKPVVWISFWDAARFVNWLNNGQGDASTETGSYTLGGVSNPAFGAGARNAGQTFYIASEDEWYKAAYYDPTKGATGGYWQHATQSNVPIGSNTDFAGADGANYYLYDFGSGTGTYANGGFSGPGTTDAGSYFNADSYFGTFDQAGNASEWNDTAVTGSGRGVRGGSWSDFEGDLQSGAYFPTPSLGMDPSSEFYGVGFRIVSFAPIPEPASAAALVALASLMVGVCRRQPRENSPHA